MCRKHSIATGDSRVQRAVLAIITAIAVICQSHAVDAQIRETSDGHVVGTGFEEFEPGPLGKQVDDSGQWEAAEGHATIHTNHRRSGRQSLRLLGGAKRQVVWTVADPDTSADSLVLWFERWTRREPFDYRIESLVNGKWQTLYYDRKRAVVGSFRNRLSLGLPQPKPTKFRFTTTTPGDSGIMIDDVRLTRAGAMTITGVTTSQQPFPVLIRNEVNPILDIQVTVDGAQQPKSVSELHINLDGTTNLDDIESVEILASGTDAAPPWRDIEAQLDSLERFGQRRPAAKILTFQGNHRLTPGTNHFFVSVKLKESADLSHRVDAACNGVVAGKLWQPAETSALVSLRIGYAVRKANDHGSKVFRIPGLVTTKKGTLIAVYDVRYRGWGDLPNDIDVGMSRSSDGGQSWEPMRVIMDMGDDPKWRYDGVGDPSILVDETTGTIWVAATWSHGNRSWTGSGPGLEPEETGQLMLVRSDDDGLTGAEPINITKQIKKPHWAFILHGPGRGITMQDRTIVFPAQFQSPPDKNRTPHSTIVYSKDHGRTWHCGTGALANTTEAAVAEIEPGVLMLNCRYDLKSRRVVMITRDLGRKWEEHPTSRKTLEEPGACMGSLIGPVKGGDQSFLFFSNPNAEQGPRRRMSIKASADRGLTWPAHWHTLLDAGNSAGYSCLTMVDDGHVGILFEGSRAHMSFLRIPLAELTHVPERHRTSTKEDREKAGHQRPNILLIVSEDNGAELGCYGDPYVKTPTLDRLSATGCQFTNAYVPQAVCSASRASFLTGLYPFQNGQIGLATHRYAMFRKWDNIPSILKDYGYRTGMIGKLHVNPESAFPFDYRAVTGNGFNDRPMRRYADAAASFIGDSDQPFLLVVNYPDAHFPLLRQQYGLPKKPLSANEVTSLPFIGADSPRLRQGTADYYNCVMRLDAGIEMLLDELDRAGKSENTLVIYIGDHGAQFSRGKATCYEGGLRIPMLVRWPGQVTPGTVRRELVSTVDILPTVLDAIGAPARASLPGRSLLPLAANRRVPWRQYLFAERTAYSAGSFFPQRTIRDARYKLILNLTPERTNPVSDAYLNQRGSFFIFGTNQDEIDVASNAVRQAYATWRNPPRMELYDLASDPWEFENLAQRSAHKTTRQRLAEALLLFRQHHGDPLLAPDTLVQLSDEHDHVANNLRGGRYGKGQAWNYQSYLVDQSP